MEWRGLGVMAMDMGVGVAEGLDVGSGIKGVGRDRRLIG